MSAFWLPAITRFIAFTSKNVFRASKLTSLFGAEKNDFSKLCTQDPIVSCTNLRVLYPFKHVPGKILALLNSYLKAMKN